MKALNLDKLDAFMEIEYDGEIYDAYTKNDINDKAISAIPLDKVKQAGEEMYEASHADADGCDTVIDLEDALEILDKLISESEEQE